MKYPLLYAMRRLISAAVLAAACCAPARAEVEWLEVQHDFGAFKEDDGRVSTTFRFVNHGPDDVAIRAARASCGCTTPSYTKEAIAPGDTASVEVSFNPTGRPGRFNKSVTVDIAGGPRTRLDIDGVVIGSSNTLRSRYPIEHGDMKLRTTQLPFGSIAKGHAKSAFLEIYNASEQPMTVKWAKMPPYIRITASDGGSIPPGEQAVYALMLTPADTELYGILTDSVYVAANGGEPVKIDLTAILEEDFSRLTPRQRSEAPVVTLDADRVNFGEFDREGGMLTATFPIKNTGKADMFIRRIYTTDPGISVSVDKTKVKKGKQAVATVTVDPRAIPADILNGRLQLIVNDPENPITIVRVVGEVRR